MKLMRNMKAIIKKKPVWHRVKEKLYSRMTTSPNTGFTQLCLYNSNMTLRITQHILRKKLDVFLPQTLDSWYKLYLTREAKYFFALMESIQG